ncbi:MAG: UDP-4-amino-4,6-dideoxy-N-acetyl-beta-L-altrosamine transaminase [Candidatus Marinimicrobia bacterium]|nr:UDP-4-amino-4,6-dideoxy-N-acetyl-beta-L-altrosamine transaminase [Candidatus Neomarinimicrobiota bacterium]
MLKKKKIPYGLHNIDDEDIQSVLNVLKDGPITQGFIVEKFGQAIADYTGAKYGVAVSSGTAALHMSVAALDIGPGDEVITTPLTFCATPNSALYQGAKVQFVDIDKDTLNIDPSLIESKINENTKAIMPVDFRGHPSNLPEIKEIAKKHGLRIIEDGSHSIGSNYSHLDKKYACGDCMHVDLCTYSFHPVKHITTGEGGAILTNDLNLYEKIHLMRKHGIDRREEMFSEKKRIGSWIYDMELLGFNYRITDFQAALGLSQLKKIEKNKFRRNQIVKYYNNHFSNIDELILPYEAENVDSNFHIYVLQVKDNSRYDRYDLFNYLQSKDYLPMVHYIPVHYLDYYKKNFGYKHGDFPISENYYERAISIPLYPSLKDEEVEKVVEDIINFFKSN